MMDFTFEEPAWMAVLRSIPQGGRLDAVELLTIMEAESEEMLEEALLSLEMRSITLDISRLSKPNATGEATLRLRREAQLVKEGKLFTDLEENDPLRLYLEDVAAQPAAGDIQLLAERYARGYEPAMQGLTNLMLSQVIQSAQEYVGRGVLLMDLIQEGSLGLWQGILSFRNGSFEAQAKWWIHQYLAKAVTLQARQLGLGSKMKEALKDYREMDQYLLSELGRNPTREEIADRLHITAQAAETLETMLSSARILEKAHQSTQEPEETEDDSRHVEDTALFQSRQRIQEMLSELPQAQARLLSLRFGLDGNLPLSPEDTGKQLGLTAEEVVAIEAAALNTLRQQK